MLWSLLLANKRNSIWKPDIAGEEEYLADYASHARAKLFAYDHGLAQVSLSPYSDPWDSALFGYLVHPQPDTDWSELEIEMLNEDVSIMNAVLCGDMEFIE